MKSALIFDLDGVIVDSTRAHTDAWRAYLHGLGISCNDIETRMLGRRNDEIVADFIAAGLAADAVAAHGAAKERLYREMMTGKLEACLVPGVADFLADAAPFPKAVASNAEPANVDFVLDGLGLRRYFQVIVDGHQVGRPKPFPDIYLRAAGLLDVPAAQCIVFEDSPTGVAAARAAGARVVGIRTYPADLEGVDLTVSDFRDPALKEWLKSVERRT